MNEEKQKGEVEGIGDGSKASKRRNDRHVRMSKGKKKRKRSSKVLRFK